MEGGGGIMAALDGCSTAERNEMSLEPRHTIFLSHSGAQKSFVEQLSMDIKTRDRCPFFDKSRNSLSIGCDFPDLIFKALNQCEVAVVVLSEEFFSRSKWPMIELAALVKRKNHDPKLTIMPVFLGLSHAQCRDKGNQDRWVKQWQRWAEEDERIVVEEWMGALKVFGYTNGVSLSESGDVMCRLEIVEAICKEVRAVTRADDSHVQGRSRLRRIIRERIEGLPLSKRYGVCILGLYGVGGIGKSTACMTLCNEYLEELKGRVCHVEFGDGDELQMLQKVLKRLTNTRHEVIERFDKDECKDKMKRAMKNERVLLAIDNVSDSHEIVEQAKWMLGAGFGEGSIIIVTARSLGQLQNLSIHESECIEMPELLEDEAMSLFLNCVDPRLLVENVEPAIAQLMRQFVEKCNIGKGDGINKHYHPLALKVLGGQLGDDREEWFGKLKEMDPFNKYGQRKEEHPVFSILRNTFDSLNKEDQLLFMDVSVLFHPIPDWKKEVDIFEWLSMVHGRSVDSIMTMLKRLKRKSLIEKLGDGSEKIGMHDLWKEFAYMEAKGGECDSGRWIYEKVYDLDDPRREESHMFGGGGKSLLRLFMETELEFNSKCKYVVMELNLCPNLRVLKLIGVFPETEVLDVASLKHLKSLEIRGTFDSKLEILGLGCLRNLGFLSLDRFDLVGGGADSPSINDEIGRLSCLRVLHLKLWEPEELPNLSRLSLLLDVAVCSLYASTISGLSSKMTNLKRLDLSFSERLRSCHGVDDLVALEELNLSYCCELEELPHLGRLKNLLKLVLSFCVVIEAVPGLGDLVSLQVFEAEECYKLAEMPDMRKLVNLQEFRFPHCPFIEAIPGLSDLIALEVLEADYGAFGGCQNLRKLTKLESVEIGGWRGLNGKQSQYTSEWWMLVGKHYLEICQSWVDLKRLKIEFADLVNLKCLLIRDIEGVDEMIGLLNSNSSEVFIQNCSFKDVECLSNLTEIEGLHVDACDLERLPDMRKLSRLEQLNILACGSLKEWKSGSGLGQFGADLQISCTLLRLQTLILREVAFTELPDLSSFPQLRQIYLGDCPDLRRLTSTAPLTALEGLQLVGCTSLRALPELSCLVSLHIFELEGCRELKLTAHEIEKLEAMCPGLELDKSHLPNMELEKDAKRLQS